jgi:16S rRNA processing protein RimM
VATPPPASADDIAIGRVVRPHGLAGEVAVEIWTDFPERFVPGLSVTLRSDAGETRPGVVATVRPHKGRMLIRFEGVDGPEAADALRGLDLVVPAGDVPPRPEGYVFHHEVQGCTVVDREGSPLGTVRDLTAASAGPLLEIETPLGLRDVPFVRPIVVEVDLAARRIVLDPPKGLLD